MPRSARRQWSTAGRSRFTGRSAFFRVVATCVFSMLLLVLTPVARQSPGSRVGRVMVAAVLTHSPGGRVGRVMVAAVLTRSPGGRAGRVMMAAVLTRSPRSRVGRVMVTTVRARSPRSRVGRVMVAAVLARSPGSRVGRVMVATMWARSPGRRVGRILAFPPRRGIVSRACSNRGQMRRVPVHSRCATEMRRQRGHLRARFSVGRWV